MDVILARAGLSAAQQRAVCLGAVTDEVWQTETKLADALAALKRLQEVARVARDVHYAQASLVQLSPDVGVSVARMTQCSEQVGPLLAEIRSTLNAFSLSGGHESAVSSTEEEDEEQASPSEWSPSQERTTPRYAGAASPRVLQGSSRREMHSRGGDPAARPSFFRVGRPGNFLATRVPSALQRTSSSSGTASQRVAPNSGYVGQKRRANSPPCPAGHSFLRPDASRDLMLRLELDQQSIWPRHGEFRMFHRRPRSPVQQTEKKVALVVDGLKQRLSQLPSEEQKGVFALSIKSALEIAGLPQVKDEEGTVQQAVDSARVAADCLLNRHSSSFLSNEESHRLEDLRQVLSVVVRAALETNGRIEASGLRDLLVLIKKLQDTFPESAARFKWCTTQLRKFITAKYKKSAQQSLADQSKLLSAVAETRKWKSINDYSATRFGKIMAFVTQVLQGSYEEWEPREDSKFAQLVGIMIIRLGAFRDSHVQRSRQIEVHGWLYKMSGTSFSPTLDLVSAPPPHTSGVYVTANQGFSSMASVEDGFKRISLAKAKKYFGFFTMTLYTFLATAVLTKNQKLLLPINQLNRFNENVQGLKELDIEGERWAVLQAYQELEKILYLMRILMDQRPAYLETSVGTVDMLLSLFPPSKRPIFEYPSSSGPPELKPMPASKPLVDESSEN